MNEALLKTSRVSGVLGSEKFCSEWPIGFVFPVGIGEMSSRFPYD